jgi:hypothetical protein
MSTRVIIIPAIAEHVIRETEIASGDNDGLIALQNLVGGYIEMPVWRAGRVGRVSAQPVINEEGKFDSERFPRNERATLLLRPDLFDWDWIAGDCVLVGANEQTGATVDLPPQFTIAMVHAMIIAQAASHA